MDRPLALGGRPLGSRPARGSSRARAGRRAPRRELHGAASEAGAVLTTLLARRRLRLALVAIASCAILLGGGFLLLRRSSLTAVRHVQVIGVAGPEAGAIDAALGEAARRMSTLGVNDAALMAAVQRFKIVRSVRAEASFPHGLRIVVTEQLPVAVLTNSAERTAVAADGVILGPALASGSLPTLTAPASDILAARASQPTLLMAVTVLGAAPEALRAHIATAAEGAQGLTVTMRNGLLVYFGDATLPHAKWLALARVLADPSSHGASYIDVRLPSRPAAGGFAVGTGPASTTNSTASGEHQQTTNPAQPTVASLAESLATAVGGPAAASAPSTTPQEQAEHQSVGSGAPSSATAEGASGAPSATSSSGSAEAGSGGSAAATPSRSAEAHAPAEGSSSAATGGSEATVTGGG